MCPAPYGRACPAWLGAVPWNNASKSFSAVPTVRLRRPRWGSPCLFCCIGADMRTEGTGRPSRKKVTVPDIGFFNPRIVLIKVVFPPPFGPMTPKKSWVYTVRSMSRKTCFPSYPTWIRFNCIRGSLDKSLPLGRLEQDSVCSLFISIFIVRVVYGLFSAFLLSTRMRAG